MQAATSSNTFNALATLSVNNKAYQYYSLKRAAEHGLGDLAKMPFTLLILMENLLRREDGATIFPGDIKALASWLQYKKSDAEIAFYPGRVLMQDFTGVPAIVDLAAMRDAMKMLGGDPNKINPLAPVDLVIDHSVQVDAFGNAQAFAENVHIEFDRNRERYSFLKWGQSEFNNFRVVPPGTGICHQVNLEYLAQVVWTQVVNGQTVAFPDTVVGTDSHTTMVNGLGVLGWGVGGIEAEAVMLGQPYSMLIPEVIGFRLEGQLREGITATDLVLTVTETLRKYGVVGKFVEFFGNGLAQLSLPDRATIANMAPEYGATCGFFPVDEETLNYLRLSGRSADTIALVEAYSKEQGLWHDVHAVEKSYSAVLSLDLSTVEPSMAGPKRPQDRVKLSDIPNAFAQALAGVKRPATFNTVSSATAEKAELQHGDVVIAAITSCTNTSNPSVMIAAGLVAKKAIERGLKVKPWVKTSLAPGSKVVTEYFAKTGLQTYLNQLGFNLVGYGCTTCIGNSGPLSDAVEAAIKEQQVMVSSVLSGNRNFEGRVHPSVEANWLASPPLVVAFALAGSTRVDLTHEPVGYDNNNKPVYLKDIWPTQHEIKELTDMITGDMFISEYKDVFTGDEAWKILPTAVGKTYDWDTHSTYIQQPPYFIQLKRQPQKLNNINNAKILALLGDSITTDHISPAGSIKYASPAGEYLLSHEVNAREFNSYGARRGNHEVMMRGTFANVRIRNEMVPGTEGGVTKDLMTGETVPIYTAAMDYQKHNIPLVVIGGKEYGTGSSRDWAAKGTLLLGVSAVIAESFERIHRGNLIGMGVLPLQFVDGMNRQTLNLTGMEEISISDLNGPIKPKMQLTATIKYEDGHVVTIPLLSRIDTLREADYFIHGGILPYVLRAML